jgi:hypothetical protein
MRGQRETKRNKEREGSELSVTYLDLQDTSKCPLTPNLYFPEVTFMLHAELYMRKPRTSHFSGEVTSAVIINNV